MLFRSIWPETEAPVELAAVLRNALGDADAGWSMGTFGAIAEFHQDPGEEIIVDDPPGLTRATARGAIRIDVDAIPRLRPVAYELLNPKPHRWSQGISLCLAEPAARRAQRTALAELGQDREAIRPSDRDAVLFDLGLNLPQVDFCIRTADQALIHLLRRHEGKSIFAADVPVMAELLHRHPHRVVLSNIGRAEVYQPIGGPATGGVSPLGPHTHVLPKLLKSGRTHSANTPIPGGLTPCGSLHPKSPVMTPLGEDCSFDEGSFKAFQSLLLRFGRPECISVKQAVWQALDEGHAPDDFTEARGRHERTALRIALRQALRLAEHHASPFLITTVGQWREHFEPHPEAEADSDDDPPVH